MAKVPRERRPWTAEEDHLLREAVKIEEPNSVTPSKWHLIAQHVPNRTNKDCRKRYFASCGVEGRIKGGWAPDEDERLCTAVREHGLRWSQVAAEVKTRNSDQCSKRWTDTLNPAIDRTQWTDEMDNQLLEAVATHGKLWTKIVKEHFPGRTGLSAKNRYNSLTRRDKDKSTSPSVGVPSSSATPKLKSERFDPIKRPAPAPAPPAPTLALQSYYQQLPPSMQVQAGGPPPPVYYAHAQYPPPHHPQPYPVQGGGQGQGGGGGYYAYPYPVPLQPYPHPHPPPHPQSHSHSRPSSAASGSSRPMSSLRKSPSPSPARVSASVSAERYAAQTQPLLPMNGNGNIDPVLLPPTSNPAHAPASPSSSDSSFSMNTPSGGEPQPGVGMGDGIRA